MNTFEFTASDLDKLSPLGSHCPDKETELKLVSLGFSPFESRQMQWEMFNYHRAMTVFKHKPVIDISCPWRSLDADIALVYFRHVYPKCNDIDCAKHIFRSCGISPEARCVEKLAKLVKERWIQLKNANKESRLYMKDHSNKEIEALTKRDRLAGALLIAGKLFREGKHPNYGAIIDVHPLKNASSSN